MTTAFSIRFAALPLAMMMVLGCNGSDGDDGITDDVTTDDGGTDDGGDGDDGGLPATGMEGMCEHIFECGSTYYDSVQECVDDAYDYWGDCRRAEVDAFGDCMINMDCDDWNPDAYNPANTPCADVYQELRDADPC